MKTLKRVMFEYCVYMCEMHEGNRTHTCKALSLSMRTLRNYFKEIRESDEYPDLKERLSKDYLIPSNSDKKKQEFYYPTPTNEQRLRHLNRKY